MIDKLTIKGSALKGVWFVVEKASDKVLAKFTSISEAFVWADNYDKAH